MSRSRNIALENSESDICLIADDDLIYIDNYEEIIKREFEKLPDADIITFQVDGIEGKYKNYHQYTKVLNYLTIMKVSSVEIAFKRDSIIKNNIEYDESFGAGSRYQMGEENIFLTQSLKKGLKIIYVTVKIADLHMGDSTWFKGYNKEYFISKGAQFTAMSKYISIIYICQYVIRKYSIFKNEMDIISATHFMFKGRREYLNKKM